MKITLLVVGKNKTDYVKEALEEYQKRINKYLQFRIEELTGVKASKKNSEREIKKKEEEQIIKFLPSDALVVLLDERGKMYTSGDFAKWLQKQLISAKKNLVFVIGGAYGFGEKIHEKADMKISLSKMTFSHQITRIVFAEQLYRAFTIIKGEPYHHGS
jgi:23S rRNA (pseudouridine1915-N3)-methyltransferase